MTVRYLVPFVAATLLLAQSFAPEFKAPDSVVSQRLQTFWRHLAESEVKSLHGPSELAQLTYGEANSVYRKLDAAARSEALRVALPLLKTLALSETVRKSHDDQMASRFGAVHHNIAVDAAGVDPMKRFEELMQAMQKNPRVAEDPKFTKELEAIQEKMSGGGTKGGTGVAPMLIKLDAPRYTKPLADLKRDTESLRKIASGAQAKCLDEALALFAAKPDAFRLRTGKCYFDAMGTTVNEAALDKERKEAAQALYNQLNLKATIKGALNEFASTAATVDFAAATASKGTSKVFVNPAYEKKSALWKMIYRNGKAPTGVAVAFAKTWIAELN